MSQILRKFVTLCKATCNVFCAQLTYVTKQVMKEWRRDYETAPRLISVRKIIYNSQYSNIYLKNICGIKHLKMPERKENYL